MPHSPSTSQEPNFAVVNLEDFSALGQFAFEMTATRKVEGKVFLKQLLHLTSAEISINSLPPQTSVPSYHKHRLNEEIYIFVQGQGEFQVDDRVFAVQQGTVVRVDPDGERCLRNSSRTENLCWIVVQSRVGSHPDQAIEDGYGVQKPVSWSNKQPL